MKHIIAALALVVSTTASAEFLDGNELLNRINGDAGDVNIATGFILGVHDASEGGVHCSPDNIAASQLRDMVKKTLQQYPEMRHRAAWLFVQWTLERAYPCQKKGKL
jgi:hypothetical protein